MLLFENYIKEDKTAFLNKVKEVSNKLNIHPDWLMAVIYKESRFNHQARNAVGGAVGLIQFMPATAAGLGTTPDKILSMSAVEQLDLVYKYYRPYAGKIKSYPDLYLATFFPAALGKNDEYIIQSSGLSANLIASQNPAIDLNKDKQITIKEFKKYCLKGFSNQVVEQLKKK